MTKKEAEDIVAQARMMGLNARVDTSNVFAPKGSHHYAVWVNESKFHDVAAIHYYFADLAEVCRDQRRR